MYSQKNLHYLFQNGMRLVLFEQKEETRVDRKRNKNNLHFFKAIRFFYILYSMKFLVSLRRS